MINGEIGNSTIKVVGAEVHERAEDMQQPEEERQLHAVPAKAQGKVNADQILDLESKLVL